MSDLTKEQWEALESYLCDLTRTRAHYDLDRMQLYRRVEIGEHSFGPGEYVRTHDREATD